MQCPCHQTSDDGVCNRIEDFTKFFFPAPAGGERLQDLEKAAALLDDFYAKWERRLDSVGDKEEEIIAVLNRLFPQKPEPPQGAGEPPKCEEWPLEQTLINVSQLLDGWHQDGTAWSAWDEEVRQNVSRWLARLHSDKDEQRFWKIDRQLGNELKAAKNKLTSGKAVVAYKCPSCGDVSLTLTTCQYCRVPMAKISRQEAEQAIKGTGLFKLLNNSDTNQDS